MDIEINDSIKSLTLQIDDIKEKISHFEGNYSALLSEDIMSKFTALNSSISNLSASYNSLQSTAENISNLLEGTNLEQMQQEITTLQSDISVVNDSINTKNTTIQENITTLQTNISLLQQSATSMNSDIAEIQNQLSELSNNLPTVDLSDIENNISTLSSQITDINSNLTNINSSLESIDEEIDTNKTTANNNQSKIQNLSDSLIIALSNISSLDSKIQDLENLCNETTLTVNSYSRTMKELTELANKLNSALNQITENKNNISSLQTQISEITTSISEINELISQLQSDINLLEEKVTSNSSNIETLTIQVNQLKTSNSTNTTNIAVLSGTLADIENRVSVLETKLNKLLQNISDNPCSDSGCMCNFKFNNIEGEIEEIRDILARLYPDVDPNKKDEIDFEEPDLAENILSTEDTIEYKNINARFVHEQPFIPICATCNETSTAKLTIDVDCFFNKIYTDGRIELFLNGTLFSTLPTPHDQLGTVLHYSFVVENVTLTNKNVIGVVSYISNGSYGYIKSFKMKIEAPNIRILNKPRPIQIDYYDNKYYISDCSSGKVNYTSIEKNKLIRTGNIKLEQMDLDATFYHTMIACVYDENDNITGFKEIHLYGSPNLKNIYVCSATDGAVESSNSSTYAIFSPGVKKGFTEIMVYSEYFRDIQSSVTFRFDSELAYFYHKSVNLAKHYYNIRSLPNSIATLNTIKYFANYWDYKNIGWSVLLTYANGDIYIINDLPQYNTSPKLKIGTGTNAKAYMIDPENNIYDIYYNFFSKTIRVRVKYTPKHDSGEYNVLERKEIGPYQNYFKGANNDYFVIQDGKILYYKDKQGTGASASGSVNVELS